jgi:hypothetical protein
VKKLNNYKLIREFYTSRFNTDEDNLKKGKEYQDAFIYPYDFIITFLELSEQLKKFSCIVKKFSIQIKNELNEKNGLLP